tara:strand:- start:4248 stop:4823 length:576 start_codon:yes stop_codon:yes gene_type:complete
MATKFTIASQALIKVGGTPITTFDGTDRQSVVVSNLYDDTKKGLLYYTFWNFATHKVQLSSLVETPTDPNFTYAYQLPGDYVRVKGVFDSAGGFRTDYAVENNKIYATHNPLYLEYIREMDESNFPPFFIEVLISKLAFEVCEGVTGVGTLNDRLGREFESKLAKAMVVDGQETPPQNILGEGHLVKARLG